MSLVKEQFEFMKDLSLLIQFAINKGWIITGGELYRTLDMQKIYIKKGLSKTMNSYHLKRLAVDLNFFKPVSNNISGSGIVEIDGKKYKLTFDIKDLEIFGRFWESLSPQNRWGGHFKTFKDTPHFERRLIKVEEIKPKPEYNPPPTNSIQNPPYYEVKKEEEEQDEDIIEI